MTTVSIIIATYNGAATLAACLDSIASQTRRPLDVIVMDGASTDGTVDILARRSDVVTHWASAPDKGIYDAWNKALPHVRGDWIWFIGCDDELADPETIAWAEDELGQFPADTGLVYTRVAMIGRNGRTTEIIGRPWAESEAALAYGMSVPHTGLLARRELFETIGGFDSRYRIAGDFDWFLKAMQRSKVAFLDRITVRAADTGLSGASATQLKTVREFGAILDAQGRRKSARWYLLLAKVGMKSRLSQMISPRVMGWLVDAYREATLRRPRMSSR